ncbi:MAG: hypothetical protein COB37_10060 [Kordiimonadales bacterium]|nr:MAG: hypothetical protein COB37_10060 [Kordiimonadales bacterium]
MYYREFEPSVMLRPFVECLWILELDTAVSEIERILPDGKAELILHYEGTTEELDECSGTWHRQGQLVFAGQRRKWLQIKPSGKSGMLGVRFTPIGAMHVLRSSMGGTADQILDLTAWSAQTKASLIERICEAPSPAARVLCMVHFLEQLLSETEPDLLVAAAAKHIEDVGGNHSQTSMLSFLETTERQLERRFANTLGTSPKRYARTIRFQRTLQVLENARASSLTDIALNHGFFDQSHFIRDFKEFSGLSPTAYRRSTHAMNDFLHQMA